MANEICSIKPSVEKPLKFIAPNENKSHIVWLWCVKVRFVLMHGTVCPINTKQRGKKETRLRMVKNNRRAREPWFVTLWINCEGWSRIYDASQMTINAQGLNVFISSFNAQLHRQVSSTLQGYYIWCILCDYENERKVVNVKRS